jgi:ADP-heptose:LPS heptosyltransferase
MNKLLVIQTAFTGDVVLATAILEKWHETFPEDRIDMLVRKGNEGLLKGHPYLGRVWVWDKKQSKTTGLLKLVFQIRKEQYTHVVNPHRFASSGLLTMLSGAGYRAGFDKNPLSRFYTRKMPHIISEAFDPQPVHEISRNQTLIADLTGDEPALPRLYPTASDQAKAAQYQERPYVCVSPASVWFTKQYPAEKWGDLINNLPTDMPVYLLGGPGDAGLCDTIRNLCTRTEVYNLCGSMNFLESAALIKGAKMNFTNDSAPLHFATAMGAPLTAVFCSTVPAFGFGPLPGRGMLVETETKPECRPCGLHGRKECPQGHFRCANDIKTEQMLWWTHA